MKHKSALLGVSLGAGAAIVALALDLQGAGFQTAAPGLEGARVVAGARAAAARPEGQPQRLETSTLVIAGQGGRRHSFSVEVARTPRQQEIGMMYRTSVGADEGMLFPFPQPRQASFWMYNTYIPLDLVFIDTNGRIESIAANAVPHSLKPLQSRGQVIAVLEIAGGQAAKLALAEGDRVLHPDLPRR